MSAPQGPEQGPVTPPPQDAQAQAEAQAQFQEMMRAAQQTQERASQRDPKVQGREQVEAAEEQVLERDYNGKSKEQLTQLEASEFKGKMQRELTPKAQEQIEIQARTAGRVREAIDLNDGLHPDYYNSAREVTVTVSMVAKAMEEGYIIPPTHEPTRAVFDSLVRKLRRHIEVDTASHLQPLLNGLLNEPDYVQFSQGEDLSTKFERDLKEILNAHDLDDPVEDILNDIFTEVITQNKIPQMTIDRYRDKINKAKEEKKAETLEKRTALIKAQKEARRGQRDRYDLDSYVYEQLENQATSDTERQEAQKARDMFESLQSADKFFDFYKRLFDENLNKILNTDNHPDINQLKSTPEGRKQIERAAKTSTEEIHKLMLYTTHLIFTPVLEGPPDKSWQDLIRLASGSMGISPESIFNNFRNKVVYLLGQATTLPGKFEEEGIPFFNFGIEEKDVYMHNETGGKMVRQKTVSSELKKMKTYKEFIERMHVALDTEYNLLQAGINFNYLLMTGKTEQQASFFQQAAAYAQQTLPSNRIDELYHLPYHELVHAAKIQISSYFKKKFAFNDWIKDPDLFYAAFDHSNKIQRQALYDLISNFGKKGVPEWAIRRAFFHARMHLSLISQEWHAYAGYGHANVTENFDPTYTDPALKHLETYRSWFAGEQWQVGDTFIQKMAFLPQPGRGRRYDKWIHEDVAKEGEDIYRNIHDLGLLTTVEREYFDKETLPNILEFNWMNIGGVEQQGGWRFKYPAASWVFDKINHLGRDNEHLKMEDKNDLTDVWKRLENLGVDVLKHTFRDHWMMGPGSDHIKLKDGKTGFDEHWKNFYGFLYDRYFSQDIGKDAFSISYYDNDLNEKNINFADINSKEEFWTKVVEPILHRKVIAAEGETDKEASARNTREREAKLKEIVTHALTVAAFERLPMDFVFMENPTRSQNGVTLLKELRKVFIDQDAGANQDVNTKQAQDFETAVDDILFVQEQARAVSINQMNDFVSKQKDQESENGSIAEKQNNIFAKDMNSLRSNLYSDVRLIEGNDTVKGYRITREVVESMLLEKYLTDENVTDRSQLSDEAKAKIERAVKVYDEVKKRIVQKPEENALVKASVSDKDIEGILGSSRIAKDMARLKMTDKAEYLRHMRAKFAETQEGLSTRAIWSENELLSGNLGIGLNDVAYPFLNFSSVGPDMVFRTIDQITGTQEQVFTYISGGDFLSNLKKYYRKEDKEPLFESISDIRSAVKNWLGPGEYNGIAMRLVENAMNVMRINSDAEDKAVELAYMANHRLRSAFSAVVKEGPEFPLQREDRFGFINEFLHYAQFDKRAKPDDRVYEVAKPMTKEELIEKKGWIGGQLAAVAQQLFGDKQANYVREQWKELSGEGLRSREFSNIGDIIMRSGPTFLALAAAALLIILIRQGYEGSSE